MRSPRPLLAAFVLISCVACSLGDLVEVDAAGQVEPSADDGIVWAAPDAGSPAVAGGSIVDGDSCSGVPRPAAVEAASAGDRGALSAMLEAGDRDGLLEADDRGVTALHAAAGKGRQEALALLLDSGLFNVEATDDEGATALLHAALAGCSECVLALHRAGASPTAQDAEGKGAVRRALLASSIPTAEALLAMGASLGDGLGRSVACVLAPRDNVRELRWALRHGAAADDHCNTIEQTPLSLAAHAGAVDALTLLIREGAWLESRDVVGLTPLFWAASRGRVDAAAVLLSQGADATGKNAVGYTAQTLAARNGHPRVEALLQRHAAMQERRKRQVSGQ